MTRTALLALLLTVSLHAATITPAFNAGVGWQKFDPALGTLTDVLISVRAYVGETFTFTPSPTYTGNHAIAAAGTADMLYMFDGRTERALRTISGSTQIAPGQTMTLTMQTLLSINADWKTGLQSFTDAGIPGLNTWSPWIFHSVNWAYVDYPKGVSIYGNEIFSGLTQEVSYAYEAAPDDVPVLTHTPEPGYVLMVGLGLAGLWWRRKVRQHDRRIVDI